MSHQTSLGSFAPKTADDPTKSPKTSQKSTLGTWSWRGLVGAVVAILALSAAYRIWSVFAAMQPGSVPVDPDTYYIHNLRSVLLHLVPGVVFCLLGPFQFSPTARKRWPRLHRVAGRVFVLFALSIGVTGLYMNVVFPPVGGELKYWANVVFGQGMVASTVLGLHFVYRRDFVRHRRWMVRAWAIGMGVGTQRLLLLPIFALLGEFDDTIIGWGVWAGWLLNVAVAEGYLCGWRWSRSSHATFHRA